MTKPRPIHPGETLLEDCMKPLGLGASRLAREIGVPANRISEIVRGRRSITADTAIRLGQRFDTTPDFWLGLQLQYDLEVAYDAMGSAA
jgi:addiction module HigA family antidote